MSKKKFILDSIEVSLKSNCIEQFKEEFINAIESVSVPKFGDNYQAQILSNGVIKITGGRTKAFYIEFYGELVRNEDSYYVFKGDFVIGTFLLTACVLPIPLLLFLSFAYLKSPEFESSFNLFVLISSALVYLFNVFIIFRRKLVLVKTIYASTSKYEL